MATVYKIELASHWVNYSEKKLKEILEKALIEDNLSNVVSIEVERK